MQESDERKFLHDIASPLGTAMFLMDVLLDSLRDRAAVNPDELEQATQVCQALEKARQMLKDRRQALIDRGVPSSGKK